MKALITGGAGFLGRKLTDALLKENFSVRLLLRDMAQKKAFTDPRVECVQGSLEDAASLDRACSGQDYVFHTAGIISYDPAKQDLMVRTNVHGTKAVAEAALRHKVKRFVYTSSTAAIGVSEDPNLSLNENSQFNARKFGLAYFDTKYDAEQELLKLVDKGLDAVILNPGSLLGPGDTRRYEKTYPGLIYKYKPPVLFHGGINYVDVDDVVEMHVAALRKGRSGERYILGGENLSFGEFITRTNTLLGRKSPTLYVPQALMGTLAIGVGFLEKMGVDLHMTPALIRQVTRWYLYVDSSKAKRELGFKPKSVDSAILGTIAWLKALGRLE